MEPRTGYIINGDTQCVEHWEDGMIVEWFDLSSMDSETFVDFKLNSQFD